MSSSASASLTDLLESYDDERNVPLLQEWAADQGVTLAEGVQLVDNGLGDWGVGLADTQALEAQAPIMTIPQRLMLSSKDSQVQDFHDAIVQSMSTRTTTINNGQQQQLDYYAPECLLMLRVLQQHAKGPESPWHCWLETLPREFATGLYLDQLERSHVERVASASLIGQQQQFEACRQACEDIHDNLPQELKAYLSSNPNKLRWAFSTVFTCSWRTTGGGEATLVPLGDFLNHDSAQPNVAPQALEDGSIQLVAKHNLEPGSPLYLSYGLGNFPGRFLVTFGFWDRSSLYMDANLTVPEAFPVDPSQLVVSTRNGGISEEVFSVGVYQFLLQRNPEAAQDMSVAQQNQNQTKVDDFCNTFDLEGALWLRLHALKIVSETYPDMDIAPENLSESPRRYGMIARYNNGMRESWMRVVDYLELEIKDAMARRDGMNKKEEE